MMPALLILGGATLAPVAFPALPPIPKSRWSDFAPGLFILAIGMMLIGVLAMGGPA